jgi:hypothetical protein
MQHRFTLLRAQIAAEGSLEGRQCRFGSKNSDIAYFFLQETGCQAKPPKEILGVRDPSKWAGRQPTDSLEQDAQLLLVLAFAARPNGKERTDAGSRFFVCPG